MASEKKDGSRKRSIVKTLHSISNDYDMKQEIGSGATGSVHVCVQKKTGTEFACKIISKKDMDEQNWTKFEEEINILAGLKHPNIIALEDVYLTPEHVYIVMELCVGGELFDRILDRTHANNRFTERDAKSIATRLFDAIAYVHAHGIVHRDLKPENILFKDETEESELKIADFGFATRLLASSTKRRHGRANTPLGTLGYMAPEMFSGKGYDERSDVWSLGVITYILLAGIPPFCELNDDQDDVVQSTPFWVYVNKMKTGASPDELKLEFPQKYWKSIGAHAKDFVQQVLQTDPLARPRSRDAQKHPWLKSSKQHAHSSTLSPAQSKHLEQAKAEPAQPALAPSHSSHFRSAFKWFTMTLKETDVSALKAARNGRKGDGTRTPNVMQNRKVPASSSGRVRSSSHDELEAGRTSGDGSPRQSFDRLSHGNKEKKLSPRAKGLFKHKPKTSDKADDDGKSQDSASPSPSPLSAKALPRGSASHRTTASAPPSKQDVAAAMGFGKPDTSDS